jgi:hypothetical protein
MHLLFMSGKVPCNAGRECYEDEPGALLGAMQEESVVKMGQMLFYIHN